MIKQSLPIEQQVGMLLTNKHQTIATAESCTGGTIAQMLTSFSGSSVFFKGAVVAYANEVKMNVLHVSESDLQTYGAVSQPVVEQMAKGVCELMHTDYAIATSGIAGPTGAMPGKPVGTVWIAVCFGNKVQSRIFHFGTDRHKNINSAAQAGLSMLKTMLETA